MARPADVDQVVAILRGVSPHVGEQPYDATSTLESDFGVSSLERAELRIRLERAYGVHLSDEAFMQAHTVGDLVALVGAAPVPASPRASAAAARPDGGQMHEARDARTLADILLVQAAAQPDSPAITFLKGDEPPRTVTYAALLEHARRMAGGLAAHGVAPGDRVGLMLPTGLGFVAGFFGTLLAGAIPVPMYPPLRPDQVMSFVERQSGIIESAGVRLLLSFAQVRGLDAFLRARASSLEQVVSADELLASPPLAVDYPRRSEDTAFIQYTSGSTGTPRGVVLSHANLKANLEAFGVVLALTPQDVVVSWLPLYHDMGLIGMLLGGLYYGLPIVLMGPEDFLMRPSRWLRALSDYGGSISAAPNFAFEICARKVSDDELSGVDLRRWRAAINGAEPVRPDTLQRFAERLGPHGWNPTCMRPAYGLAEATLAVTMALPGRLPRLDKVSRESLDLEGWAAPATGEEAAATFVSCGRAVQGVEVRIVSPKGRPLKERWQGHVQFRGASAFRGYYRNAEATAEMVGDDGWIDAGDLGYIADGELYVTGRRKALILVAGRNVHAEDVERAASGTPGVRTGCVASFGVTREGTERLVVVAETQVRDGRERQRISDDLRQRVLEGVGIGPDEVRLVPAGSVPKTPSGKIRRSACRDMLLGGTLGKKVSVRAQIAHLATELPGYLARRAREGVYAAWSGACVAIFGGSIAMAAGLGVGPAVTGPASRAMLRLCGIRLAVEGPRPRRGPLLLVPNHTSMADPFVVMAAAAGPVRFAAAAWVADLAVIGPIIRRLGGVRIERGTDAQRGVRAMERVLGEGACLVTFAEGGIEVSPGLRPFMIGPFQAAANQHVPVVPVSIEGMRRVLRWGQRIPRPGVVRVVFGEPIEPSGTEWDEVTDLVKQVRAQVAAHCGEPMVQRRLLRED